MKDELNMKNKDLTKLIILMCPIKKYFYFLYLNN